MGPFVIGLLIINATLVLAIIFVLRSLGKQARRVSRIAQEAHDLAERAERHAEETGHPEAPHSEPADAGGSSETTGRN